MAAPAWVRVLQAFGLVEVGERKPEPEKTGEEE